MPTLYSTASAGQWLEIDLPFADFVLKFRGSELDLAPPEPAQISGMGLMIADGKGGPFAIAVDSVPFFAISLLETGENQ